MLVFVFGGGPRGACVVRRFRVAIRDPLTLAEHGHEHERGHGHAGRAVDVFV